MAVLAEALANDLLDIITSGTPYASLKMALYTAAPNPATPLANEADATGTSTYARQTITFGAASGGVILNDIAITFAGVRDETFTHAAVFEAATDNMLWYGPLTLAVTPVDLGSVDFAIGEINFELA